MKSKSPSPPAEPSLSNESSVVPMAPTRRRWRDVLRHKVQVWRRPGGFVEQMQFDGFMDALSTLTTQQLSQTLQQFPWLGLVQGQKDGRTALMRVAALGDVDKLLLLLPLSRPNAIDHNRNNALKWTLLGGVHRRPSEKGREGLDAPPREALNALDCASILLPHTALHALDDNGETLLVCAARHDAVEFLRVLLPHMEASLKKSEGPAALGEALIFTSWSCVQELAHTVSSQQLSELIEKARCRNEETNHVWRRNFAERCQALVEQKTLQETIDKEGARTHSESTTFPPGEATKSPSIQQQGHPPTKARRL